MYIYIWLFKTWFLENKSVHHHDYHWKQVAWTIVWANVYSIYCNLHLFDSIQLLKLVFDVFGIFFQEFIVFWRKFDEDTNFYNSTHWTLQFLVRDFLATLSECPWQCVLTAFGCLPAICFATPEFFPILLLAPS